MLDDAYLGISLGRSYYTSERLGAYCAWAKLKTARFAFLIGDDLFQYNLRAFKKMGPKAALDRARRKGDDLERQIRRILLERGERAEVIRWRQLANLPRYKSLYEEGVRLTQTEPLFEQAVRRQVFINLGMAVATSGFRYAADTAPAEADPHDQPLSFLHMYMLHEIAGLVVISEDLGYEVEVYPGPELEIMERVYSGQWPTLRALLPAQPERRFMRLELDP